MSNALAVCLSPTFNKEISRQDRLGETTIANSVDITSPVLCLLVRISFSQSGSLPASGRLDEGVSSGNDFLTASQTRIALPCAPNWQNYLNKVLCSINPKRSL